MKHPENMLAHDATDAGPGQRFDSVGYLRSLPLFEPQRGSLVGDTDAGDPLSEDFICPNGLTLSAHDRVNSTQVV